MELKGAGGSDLTGPPAAGARPRAGETPAEVREAASQFAALLVREVLKTALPRGVMGMGDLGGRGAGTVGSMFSDMLLDSLSRKVAGGQGGLREVLEHYLQDKGVAGAAPGQGSVPASDS